MSGTQFANLLFYSGVAMLALACLHDLGTLRLFHGFVVDVEYARERAMTDLAFAAVMFVGSYVGRGGER